MGSHGDKPACGETQNSNWRQNVDSHEFFYQKINEFKKKHTAGLHRREEPLAWRTSRMVSSGSYAGALRSSKLS